MSNKIRACIHKPTLSLSLVFLIFLVPLRFKSKLVHLQRSLMIFFCTAIILVTLTGLNVTGVIRKTITVTLIYEYKRKTADLVASAQMQEDTARTRGYPVRPWAQL